jgi:hypothetical protein
MYRLVYISTRNFDGSLIPIDLFEPIPLKYVYDNYNDADLRRCEMCSELLYGFVKIVEE